MKCLTVHQPWAWLIVNGHKDVENRVWSTRYRGPLLIHASKTFDHEGAKSVYERIKSGRLPRIEFPPGYHSGCIVGAVILNRCETWWTAIKTGPRSPWHNMGAWGWHLENATRFAAPAPLRGRQRIFNVSDDEVVTNPRINIPAIYSGLQAIWQEDQRHERQRR